MAILPGRLGTLAARDVMTKVVIVLSESDRIGSAISKLKESRITGAPVVDDTGKFVGILSISDLLRTAPLDAEVAPTALAHEEGDTTWHLFESARPLTSESADERVRDRMSRRVTSISDGAPLVEVARVMCGGHWHRVPVVDDVGGLCGIISTMDVLAALVNAADEDE